jgi:hypothetical protein
LLLQLFLKVNATGSCLSSLWGQFGSHMVSISGASSVPEVFVPVTSSGQSIPVPVDLLSCNYYAKYDIRIYP